MYINVIRIKNYYVCKSATWNNSVLFIVRISINCVMEAVCSPVIITVISRELRIVTVSGRYLPTTTYPRVYNTWGPVYIP